jgi:hypothetical protein
MDPIISSAHGWVFRYASEVGLGEIAPNRKLLAPMLVLDAVFHASPMPVYGQLLTSFHSNALTLQEISVAITQCNTDNFR